MQARSALFDLYGDYLRPRGGRAPVSALVRLLAPLAVAAPAVRTAVSRMVRQGWLLPVRINDSAGYQLSVKAVHRLDEAASRIYRTAIPDWDGTFDLLLIINPPPSRARRARLHAGLAYHGYGQIDAHTWIAPRPAEELGQFLAEAKIEYERFRATHAAGSDGTAALVRRAWDLDSLAKEYLRFVAELTPTVNSITDASPDQDAFAARFQLVHGWRAFLFRDPLLPATLLSNTGHAWPGARAASFFDHHEARLRPGADHFVDSCLRHARGSWT